MNLPTWEELIDFHCHKTHVKTDGVLRWNKKYEPFSSRRYNFSTRPDNKVCRLVFLNSVLEDSKNKTLIRDGRFIWCKELAYEGVCDDGLRQISFSVDKGKKRFKISENNINIGGNLHISFLDILSHKFLSWARLCSSEAK